MRPIAIILACLALAACAPKAVDDPFTLMTSKSARRDAREAAVKQAEREYPRDPRRVAALQKIAFEAGYEDSLRRYAIDELVKIDEADFQRVLAKRIMLINDWDTLEKIFAVAAERKWTGSTPTFVRQYARPAKQPDKDRAERKLLEQLNPGKSVEQVVFEVFADADDKMSPTEQVAAWELLNRISTKQELTARLAEAPAKTPLVIDLKAASADLGAVPVNREGVLWLAALRSPGNRAFYDAAKARVASLPAEKRESLELRHLPVLVHADAAIIAMSREQLSGDIRSRLSGVEHHLKTTAYDGQAEDYPQRFEEWDAKLNWADLVVVRWAITAVQDRALASALFTQAREDHLDTSTEYGGAIVFRDASGGAIEAKLFKPEMRRHDLKYYAPPALVESLYTGAAHYHFHAQKERNADYAGPGRGDQEFAKKLNFNCLVFTYVDANKMNVDFYQPDGAVIDLGTITR